MNKYINKHLININKLNKHLFNKLNKHFKYLHFLTIVFHGEFFNYKIYSMLCIIDMSTVSIVI